ncbi:MAG: alpha/beta fold hydrolase [Alphaproteobacteria bacterium]|nr:alpha/beta fold hydrolase [Alphaproteobacteria bacterium]
MAEGQFRTSDGETIAYWIDDFTDPWTKPETLLLLHSAMGHAQRFYAWVPLLCRQYPVVRMDLRGHGASSVPAPSSPLTMERLVQDVVELMDRLGIPNAHVVGNSAGGYIGQNLAMTAPDRVRTLALFGSTPGLKQSQAGTTWLPRIAKEGLRNFLADTIAERFPMDRTDPGLIQWFLDEAAKNDTPYIGRFVGLMASLYWPERLDLIRCPTLIVAPGAETVGALENYHVMRDRILDNEFLVYEGLPHNICDAVPERCAEEVRRFLGIRGGR